MADSGALNPDGLAGGPASVYRGTKPKATLTTDGGSAFANIKVEAIDGGVDGNSLILELLEPSGDAALSVDVSGTAPAYTISVTLETSTSTSVSTGQEVANAINGHVGARGLVVASVAAGDDPTDTVTAFTADNLAGGTDTVTMEHLGYLGGPLRFTPSIETLDLRGQQAGRAPIKRKIALTGIEVEITIAEITLERLAIAYGNAVIMRDGGTPEKVRVEWRDTIGRDLLKASSRWEIREYDEMGAETTDPQKIIVLPRAAPSTASQPLVYDVDTQRTATFTLDCYPDAQGRRAFRGNEDF